MSVQSVVHVKPDMSVLVEKPVRYAIDPNGHKHPKYVDIDGMPYVYLRTGQLAFFAVNGYLSHCWADKSGLDLSLTRNTAETDSAAFGPDPSIQWKADLLSDVYLTRGSHLFPPNRDNWAVRTFYHRWYGPGELHIYFPWYGMSILD